MREEFIFQSFAAQDEFAKAFWSMKYNRLLLGGSIRSGKTYVCVAILLMLARIFPGSKWVIIRKDWPKLRSTTMKVFLRLCPKEMLKDPDMPFNGMTKESVFKNGSMFIWMTEPKGIDKDGSAKGLYINGAFEDEADGLNEDFRNAVRSRLGSHKDSFAINAETKEKVFPPAMELMTCNPNQGPLKENFYLRSQSNTLPERHYFQNLTIKENPYVTPEDLEEFKDWPEDIFNKFINGSWDALDDDKQLIKWRFINQCHDVIEEESDDYYLGVDVARQGKDKLVYFLFKGSNIHSIEYQDFTENTMEIVARVERFISEFSINESNVVIDGVGIGAGVVDRLHEKNIYVINFIGGAAATTQWGSVFTFQNMKSQAYWGLKEKLKAKAIGNLTHTTLKAELASIWYTTDEKNIRVDSKDKYKIRTGKSPDFADAMMYAYWAKFRHEFVPQLTSFEA